MAALTGRIYESLPGLPCATVQLWVHMLPPAGVPRKKKNRHQEWYNLLPARHDPPKPPQPPHDGRLGPRMVPEEERLPLPPEGDHAAWRKYRNLFSKYETVDSRNIDGPEVSRLMQENSTAYTAMSRYSFFIFSPSPY